jgi:hypothetical protein
MKIKEVYLKVILSSKMKNREKDVKKMNRCYIEHEKGRK